MMRRILVVANDYRGGVETFIKQLKELDSSKYNTSFAFYKKDKYGIYDKNDYFLNIPGANKLWQTVKLINKLHPDVVVTFPNYALVKILFAGLFTNYKFTKVAIVNNHLEKIAFNNHNYLAGKIIHSLVRFCLKHYDRVVFISLDLKNYYVNKYALKVQKSVVIEHSVNNHEVVSRMKEKLMPFEKKIFTKNILNIFAVGRLDSQKDFITVVRSFAKVLNKIKKVQLYIIGDGEEKQKIKHTVSKLKLDSNVLFLGWKANIYKYLKHADLFVFSSKYEGFAMVIVEAMAAGIPVVTTNTPFGPREITANGKYGILVPIRNSEKMAEAIIKLSKSKILRNKYKNLGLKRAKKYDSKIMVNKFETLFSDL